MAADAPVVGRLGSLGAQASAHPRGRDVGTEARSAGLVAAFSFDRLRGDVAPDLSGHGNAARLVNVRSSRQGRFGGALSFAGHGSFIRVRRLPSRALPSRMTLEAWVRPSVLVGRQPIIVTTTRGDSLCELQLRGNKAAAVVSLRGTRHVTRAPRRLAARTWSFLALTWDGTRLRLYVNGRPVAGTRAAGALASGSRSVEIGGATRGPGFRGRIDNVRIYDGALTPNRISVDMRSPVTAANYTPPPVSIMPPVGTAPVSPPGGTKSPTPPVVHCVWYVDRDASGANNGASWVNAWTSFSAIKWASVQPGDAICLSGGRTSQTYTGTMTIERSGTAALPITIAAGHDPGHNGAVILDYSAGGAQNTAVAISLNGQNHITISGLRINNLYNTASGTSSVGIYGSGDTGITVTDMSFTNDNNPVRITSATRNVISNSYFYRTRGDAAIALAGSTGGFDSTEVYGNYIETVCQQGGSCDQRGSSTSDDGPDGVQNGSGVSVHDNTFKEIVLNETTSRQHPDMIQNQGNYTKVYDNDFVNVGDSNFDYDGFAAGGSVHDIWIYNNVFQILTPIDPYPDFIRLYSSGSAITSVTNFKVMSNVFADSSAGGGVPPVNICYYAGCAAGATGTGCQVTNNIFVNDGDGSSAGAMLAVEAAGGSGWTANNNVYYRASNGYVTWKGTSFSAATFVSTIDKAGRTALPAFSSYSPGAASNDFHLASADTVATNHGANLSGYFASDRDQVARPASGPWNIGPYQR
jgi:Concanavalin A-like lectin/glucanases superfamily